MQHEWLGYIGQRNLVRKMAMHPWVLFIDADEEISPQLREAILKEFSERPNRYVGYEFPRLVFYLGKWIRHGAWYPDLKLRLFLKDKGRSGGVEPHDQVVLEGPIKRLNHPIWHYTYADITAFVYLGFAKRVTGKDPAQGRENLSRWAGEISERPAVAAS